jgi:hypothetical protein
VLDIAVTARLPAFSHSLIKPPPHAYQPPR